MEKRQGTKRERYVESGPSTAMNVPSLVKTRKLTRTNISQDECGKAITYMYDHKFDDIINNPMSEPMMKFLLDLYKKNLIDHLLDYIHRLLYNKLTESLALSYVIPDFIEKVPNNEVKSYVNQLLDEKITRVNQSRQQGRQATRQNISGGKSRTRKKTRKTRKRTRRKTRRKTRKRTRRKTRKSLKSLKSHKKTTRKRRTRK